MSNQRVAIIDYGMGNLHSASKALEHVAPDADVIVTSDSAVIEQADRVVFPGVGAIRDCMSEIRRLGFDTLVPKMIQEKPVLAICVGMQALLESSEENGGVACIGAVPGHVNFFGENLSDPDGESLKVPHMGWNNVHQTADHPMWQGIAQDSRFYFVHSYYVELANSEAISATSNYAFDFCSAFSSSNLFAVQFHPEKSHDSGLQLLRNFIGWNGS